jgi:hypothetical protein
MAHHRLAVAGVAGVVLLAVVAVAARPGTLVSGGHSAGAAQTVTIPTEIGWQLDADLPGSNPTIFTVGVVDAGNGHYGLFGRSCYTQSIDPVVTDCGPIEGNLEVIEDRIEVGLDSTDSNDKGTAERGDDFHGTIHHHFLLDPATLNGTFHAVGVYTNVTTGGQYAPIAYGGTVTQVAPGTAPATPAP